MSEIGRMLRDAGVPAHELHEIEKLLAFVLNFPKKNDKSYLRTVGYPLSGGAIHHLSVPSRRFLGNSHQDYDVDVGH